MSAVAQVPPETPAANVDLRGGGPPVLLLHGWGASAELMLPVARLLGDRRCIVPDLPGHGQTPQPTSPWAVGDYVRWTVSLLDRLGVDRCDVIAHSFGARVAIKLAAEHPHRVRQLVLTGAAGIRPRLSLRRRARVRLYKLARPLARSRFTPQPLRVRLRSWQERQGSADYRAARGVMRDTFVRVVNEDLSPHLGRLRAPTLLVWGDGDDATPLADAQLMERLIPDAGLVVLDGVDHFAYLERLSDFCLIVDTFLKGSEA